MTSKEKIVEIINKYLWKFDVDKLADELFEEFEKDLVVLETLKKYINIANNGFAICGNYYDEKDFKKEDFRKIKEWLENGINNK